MESIVLDPEVVGDLVDDGDENLLDDVLFGFADVEETVTLPTLLKNLIFVMCSLFSYVLHA